MFGSIKTKEDPALKAIEARNQRNDLDAMQKDATAQTSALARLSTTPAAGAMAPPIMWKAGSATDAFQNMLMKSMLKGRA